MSDVAKTMAKLSGIRKAISAVASENVSARRGAGEVKTRAHFDPDLVKHYFSQAKAHVDTLRKELPDLFEDFQPIVDAPKALVNLTGGPGLWFGREQIEQLGRDIDQIFEIRANSQLAEPVANKDHRVFLSHGSSSDWREVQAYIERDAGLLTLELAQEPNLGRTVIEKLIAYASRCDSAVIVMTGDDQVGDVARVRENVMHEVGFFQGAFGRAVVVLLHEEGVSIPSNLSGVVYIPFPKGAIAAGFAVLRRELDAIYGR